MADDFSFSVKSDVREVTRYLSALQKRQLPFVTASALTKTAQDVQVAETKQIDKSIDRPTRFTHNAIGIKGAKKTNLTALVFVKDVQEEYLHWSIFGGTRLSKGKGTGVPTRNKKLNRYGNIPGRRTGLVKGSKQFIATIRGVSGVWERTGGKRNPGIRLLVAFEKVTRYRRRFPFFEVAQRTASSKFVGNFNQAMARAIATAR